MSQSEEAKNVELTEAEKKQLLRERRKAKMAKGNASDRLNNILSQSSSIKHSTVKSVLDEEESPIPTSTESVPPISLHEDDPEIQDITSIAMQLPISQTPPIGEGTPEDIDAIFNKIFQQQTTGISEADLNDPMAKLMKMFAEGVPEQGLPTDQPMQFDQDPNISKYQKELYEYQQYQQKLWKFRFLVIRFICTSFNFLYHFFTIPNGAFSASSHSYVRELVSETPVNMFLMWFLTVETVILSSYYFISSKVGLFQTRNENSLILKGMSLGSMIFPQLNSIRPIVARAFQYHDLVGIVLGDLSLIVVYFGLLSFTR